MSKTILLSAGGTGGHLFPAQALAQLLRPQGWTVHLATDARAQRFVANFPADDVHIIKSATFGGKNPVALAKTFSRLGMGYISARRLIGKTKPDVVVGFGGYPTVPPLLAAIHKGVPTILHEQNAVMGRANKFLASRVSAVAVGFELADGGDDFKAPVAVTGNPLRAAAHNAAKQAYIESTATGPFNLLVFGGSQGAQFFAKILPAAIALLEPSLINRLNVVLQARPEDENTARDALKKLNVDAEVSAFFGDMPQRIADAHLVVSRSGASTVSELALIGRPSVLVPYPGALDDDQGKNAALLEQAGGSVLVRQKDMSAERLAKLLSSAARNPDALSRQAEAAKSTAVPDAAQRLAAMIEAHT